MTDTDFASLLCSRLCHDLLSPVGALNNGLELLADEDDPAMRDQVLELLADSARATAEKLKFFRLAFGAAGGYGAMIETDEAKQALAGVLAEKKVDLGWMVADAKLPKDAVKLLLNLSLIAGDALVRGGRLDVGAERGEGGIELAVRAEGPRLLLDPNLRAMLVDGPAGKEGEARTAAAQLAHALAASSDSSIRLSDPDDGLLVMGVSLPQPDGMIG
ncbi:histidine phosphotransferase family protein [Sphingomicrobium clamense]|uniref:Histidine phosphotransferase n=1 Tax=Sphingomicrobium clamense TaxID=2851013 RepID=A0ABS6V667_9SPHN|nr:histidine phosphotransferase family protein [Sphingomicrobium sp. B8]MBW0145014.1 histidine phosphotransferase [Sphingomicrobium sp. B8]